MKKTVKVTIEKTFEIEIDDKHLSVVSMAEFESYMFSLEDANYNNSTEAKQNSLFKYVARMVFDEDEVHVEGIGQAIPYYRACVEFDVKFKLDDVEYDNEITEE